MSPLISVIIPVYNVEKYIEDCLFSVLNQSYKNLEILVVNDGSTDNSLKVVEKIAKKDKRISILSQENKGLGGARNKGISISKADYILFVDSDDTINEDMIDELYKTLLLYNSDIVTCRFNRLYRDGKIDLISHPEKYTEDLIKDILLGHVAPMAWNKLFKKELFINWNITFTEKEYYEDHFPILQLFSKAKKVHHCDKVLYNWYITNSSISRTLSDKHIIDFLNVMKNYLDFLKNKQNFKIYKDIFVNRVFYLINSHILINFKTIKKEDVLDLLELLNSKIIDLFNEIDFFKILKEKYRGTYINFFSKIIDILNFHEIEINFINNLFFFDKHLLKKLDYFLDDIYNIETLLYKQIIDKKCNSIFIYAGGKICEGLVELIINDGNKVKIEKIIDSNVNAKNIKGIKTTKIDYIPIEKLNNSFIVVASEAYEKEIISILKVFTNKNDVNLKIISPYGFI